MSSMESDNFSAVAAGIVSTISVYGTIPQWYRLFQKLHYTWGVKCQSKSTEGAFLQSISI